MIVLVIKKQAAAFTDLLLIFDSFLHLIKLLLLARAIINDH